MRATATDARSAASLPVAANVLVPGGFFICYLGQHRLNEKLRILDEHLVYQWLGTSRWIGTGSRVHPVQVVSNSTPFVVCTKGQRQQQEWTKWLDTLEFEMKEKEYHPWQKPLAGIESLLRSFTKPGDLVVEPCGGGFTTAVACQRLGRKCISCEIDKAYVLSGLERLAKDADETTSYESVSVSIDVDLSAAEAAVA